MLSLPKDKGIKPSKQKYCSWKKKQKTLGFVLCKMSCKSPGSWGIQVNRTKARSCLGTWLAARSCFSLALEENYSESFSEQKVTRWSFSQVRPLPSMSSVASICRAGAEKEKHQLINTFSLQHPCSPGDFPFKGSAQEGRGDADTRGTEQQCTPSRTEKMRKWRARVSPGRAEQRWGRDCHHLPLLPELTPYKTSKGFGGALTVKEMEDPSQKKITGRDGEGSQGAYPGLLMQVRWFLF